MKACTHQIGMPLDYLFCQVKVCLQGCRDYTVLSEAVEGMAWRQALSKNLQELRCASC